MATNPFEAGFNLVQKRGKQGNDYQPISSTGDSGDSAFDKGFNKGTQGVQAQGAVKRTLEKAKRPVQGLQTTQTDLKIPFAKHGGKVTKTGLVYVHRGEQIVPAKRRSGKQRSGRKASAKTVIKA